MRNALDFRADWTERFFGMLAEQVVLPRKIVINLLWQCHLFGVRSLRGFLGSGKGRVAAVGWVNFFARLNMSHRVTSYKKH